MEEPVDPVVDPVEPEADPVVDPVEEAPVSADEPFMAEAFLLSVSITPLLIFLISSRPVCRFFSRSLLSLLAHFFTLVLVASPVSGAISKPATTPALAPANIANMIFPLLSFIVIKN